MNALADEAGRRVAVDHLEARHAADLAALAEVRAAFARLWGITRSHTPLSDEDIALRACVGADLVPRTHTTGPVAVFEVSTVTADTRRGTGPQNGTDAFGGGAA